MGADEAGEDDDVVDVAALGAIERPTLWATASVTLCRPGIVFSGNHSRSQKPKAEQDSPHHGQVGEEAD
jgi:hypothetical protein